MADLFITDAEAIKDIRSGKREVSCGYDASYEATSPGYGIQKAIIGNHVAIVDSGRCGPMCKIGDSAMSVIAAKPSVSWKDRIRRAFMTRDAAEFEKAVSEAPADKPVETPPAAATETPPAAADNSDPGGVHHHITVNVGGQPAAGAAAVDADPAAAAAAAAAPVDPAAAAASADPLEIIAQAISTLAARVEALEAQLAPKQEGDGDIEGQTMDAKGVTLNQLREEYQDTLARVEILTPGMRVPTFDAAATQKDIKTAICGFRRRSLDAALGFEGGRELLADIYDSRTPIKAMTCDAVKVLFLAASSKARDRNNSFSAARDEGAKKTGIRSLADINKRNHELWGRRT
jgi:hypothetical protein